MALIANLVRTVVLGGAILATPAAFAQEITPSHMAAALEAVTNAEGMRGFDNILPQLAESVSNRLIRARPDLHKQITESVQATALKLVPRRKDLDIDVARIWAKGFTEQELVVISTFFKSTAGRKYLKDGPKIVTDSFQAVQRWSERVGEELYDKAKEELKKRGFEL